MRFDRIRLFAGLTVMTMLLIFTIGSIRVSAQELPEISAKYGVVYNPATGEVIFDKNAEAKAPMASTTKIMSALIVLQREDLDVPFVVDSEAIKTEGSSMGLREGDQVTLRALVCGMLLPSGNDAANAAAVRVGGSVEGFVELMNRKASELGLENTHFVTPSGLDDYTDEHYSTALDMAKLAAEAMKNDEFRRICSKDKIKVCFGDPPYERWLTNTNKLLKMGSEYVGIKTGFTDKAKRCLVSACDREKGELICVTLNAPDDWNDHVKLYDYGYSKVSMTKIKPPADSFCVSVVGGESERVLCGSKGFQVLLGDACGSQVKARVFLPQFVYAPVKDSDVLGRIDYYYEGRLIGSRNIVSVQQVDKAKAQKDKSKAQGLFGKLMELFG